MPDEEERNHYLGGMDKIPVYLRKPVFRKLFRVAGYNNLNRKERKMYNVSLKTQMEQGSKNTDF